MLRKAPTRNTDVKILKKKELDPYVTICGLTTYSSAYKVDILKIDTAWRMQLSPVVSIAVYA